MNEFEREVADRVAANATDQPLQATAAEFMKTSIAAKYSYNFSWLGRPIIQYPQDILRDAGADLVACSPTLIIETGIAHGGSLIFSASMLELNAACGGPKDAKRRWAWTSTSGRTTLPAIEAHPMFRRITMIEGSSVAPSVVDSVRAMVAGKNSVLVCLDSNHTHEHVLAELEAYAPMTTVGSYCVVFDTIVENLPESLSGERPWGPGDNPMTAARRYLHDHAEFEIDHRVDAKILIGVAPHGYLRRVR